MCEKTLEQVVEQDEKGRQNCELPGLGNTGQCAVDVARCGSAAPAEADKLGWDTLKGVSEGTGERGAGKCEREWVSCESTGVKWGGKGRRNLVWRGCNVHLHWCESKMRSDGTQEGLER